MARTLEHFFDHLFRPPDTSAVCLEILSPYFAPDATCLQIIKGLGDGKIESSSIFNAAARTTDFKNPDDLARVLEMWPE